MPRSVPLAPKLALLLALALLPASAAAEKVKGKTQLAGAELEAECRDGCAVSGEIRDITSRKTDDGREVQVSWQLGSVPPDLKLRLLQVAVAVTLESGKVLEGSRSVGVQFAGSVPIEVKGGFLGLNKGKREKAVKVRARLIPFTELRAEKIPKLEVLDTLPSTLGLANVRVVYALGVRSPCDATSGILLKADAVTAKGHKLHGEKTVEFSSGNEVVTLEGLGKRRADELRNVRATAEFLVRRDIVCPIEKTVPVTE